MRYMYVSPKLPGVTSTVLDNVYSPLPSDTFVPLVSHSRSAITLPLHLKAIGLDSIKTCCHDGRRLILLLLVEA